MKRLGIEAIYFGGWGSTTEDPGPDLASYPLLQVPDEASVLARALLTADRNQQYQRTDVVGDRRHEGAETPHPTRRRVCAW